MGRAGGDREHMQGSKEMRGNRKDTSRAFYKSEDIRGGGAALPLSLELRGGQRPSGRLLSPPVRPPRGNCRRRAERLNPSLNQRSAPILRFKD